MQKSNYVTFPIDEAKKPMLKKWQNLTKSARSRARYGILCGMVNNLSVVDIDTDGLTKWAELIQEHGEIDTPKVKTPSGGFHYYFNYAESLKNWVKTNGAGIDTRTEGGFVVGFSSTGYELINDVPKINIPEWLLNYLTCNRTPTVTPGPGLVGDVELIKTALDLFNSTDADAPNHSGIKSESANATRTKINLNRIRPSNCDICNKTHDKDNTAYILAFNNGCVKKGCTRSPELITLTSATVEFDKYTLIGSTEYEAKYCSDFEPLMKSRANILASRAQMGTGKTNAAAIRLNDLKPDDKALILSFRISLSEQYLNDKFKNVNGLVSYKNIDKIDNTVQRLIIQPESIYKINWNLANKPIQEMVIDEVTQVMSQFTSSTFLKQKHARESWAKFKMLIRNTNTIHIMDANLTYRQIKWIKDIRSNPGDLVHVFDNTFKNLKDREIKIYNNHLQIIDYIATDLNENKRVYLACNGSTEKIDAYAKIFKTKQPNAKILIIHRDTMGRDDVKKALTDPNTEWKNWDLIITSPSIQSGISYDQPDFDKVYGIFGNYTSGTNDCGQMLQRIRHPKCKTLKVSVAMGNHNIGPLTRDALIKQTEDNNAHIATGLNDILELSDYEYNAQNLKVLTENDYTRLWVENSINRNWDLMCFMQNFIKLHERMGLTVTISKKTLDEELNAAYTKMIKIIRNELKTKTATEIANALTRTEAEIKKIKEKLDQGKNVTQDDLLSLKKNAIIETYAVSAEQSPEWFEKYGDKKLIKHFKNQKILAASNSFKDALEAVRISEIKNVKYNEDMMQDPEKEYTAEERLVESVMDLVKRSPRYARWDLLLNWVTRLGYPTFDSDAEYTADILINSFYGIQEELPAAAEWITSILEKSPGYVDTIASTPRDGKYLRCMLDFINWPLKAEWGIAIKKTSKYSNLYALSNMHAKDFRMESTDAGDLPYLRRIIPDAVETSEGEDI